MNIARRESALPSKTGVPSTTYDNVLGIAMSVPRLGFMDDFFCIFQTIQSMDFRVPLRKYTGAFWGQCLTRTIEELIAKDNPALIMTIDYDTVFLPEHVIAMLDLMRDNPHVDAIAPIEMHRTEPRPLFSIKENGKFVQEVPDDYFAGDLLKISTAHMGCMIFRTAALQKLKKPWFWSQPDVNGRWEPGHIDDDTWFWQQWEAAGNSLYLANRVPVGHAELLIRWPDTEFNFLDQHPGEFWSTGLPEGVWK